MRDDDSQNNDSGRGRLGLSGVRGTSASRANSATRHAMSLSMRRIANEEPDSERAQALNEIATGIDESPEQVNSGAVVPQLFTSLENFLGPHPNPNDDEEEDDNYEAAPAA